MIRAALTAVVLSACSAPVPPQVRGLAVLPVLFVPAGVTLPQSEVASASQRLDSFMALAQGHYRELLGADAFSFEPGSTAVYPSGSAVDAYEPATSPDSAHLMAKELLAWRQEDRNGSRTLYVVLLARPAAGCSTCVGGGRTFNGPPGTGGGIIQLELESLGTDVPYPFLSTLEHELGHGLGLSHSDCHGEDLQGGESIMSYNPAHHSSGLSPSATPGTLLPEEYFLLDGVVPGFRYTAATHNPGGRALVGVDGQCELRAMDESLGAMSRLGFQLFFDGAVVSGPEAQFMTRGEAKDSCAWNLEHNADRKIRCLFDGVRFGGNVP